MGVESNRDHAQRGPGVPATRQQPARKGTGQDAIRRLLEPVIGAAGFDLEDLVIQPAGRRRLVRVVVDADGGISLDDVAAVNHLVSQALDDTDLMGSQPYVLEVTSPGVDRPLTEPRHWRRAVGRLVRTSLTGARPGGDGPGADRPGGEIEGRVVAADDEAVVIDVAGDERRLYYGEVDQGRVQVEFRRTGQDTDAADED
ncbi:ribosome maturation factor RimP [Actinomadura scrupuli]|uniref:ribosome maturation factor RimP n=1 Tax=Actinomadura scrupuli TaxID=559629 RepID=UPI003D957A62